MPFFLILCTRLFSAASKELDLRQKLPKKRASILERLGPPVKMSLTDEGSSVGDQSNHDISWNPALVHGVNHNDIQHKSASLVEAVAVLGAVVGTAHQIQGHIQHAGHSSFLPPSQTLDQEMTVNNLKPFYENLTTSQSTIDPELVREREAFFRRSDETPKHSNDQELEREREAFFKRSEEYARREERHKDKEAVFKPRWGLSGPKEEQVLLSKDNKREDLLNRLSYQVSLGFEMHEKTVIKMSSLDQLPSTVEQREETLEEREDNTRRPAEVESTLQLKKERDAKEELSLRDAEEEKWRLQLQAEQNLKKAAEELKKQAEVRKMEEEVGVRQEDKLRKISPKRLRWQEEEEEKEKERERRRETEKKLAEERKNQEDIIQLQRDVEERLRKQREQEIKQVEIQRLREIAEQRKLEEVRQKKEMERVAQLERERQQEEIWRREEAERREVERRVAAEREEVERLRRVVEEKERQRMEHEQYLIAEENRRRQEMAAQQFAAEQQRREAMEMERKRRAAAEEQQRLEYQRIVEERKVLLRRRQQLDILERQQQEELRLRQRNAVREPGPKHGLVNPMYSNYLNTRGRGAPRGRGICMPPPSSQMRSQHVGCMEADDGDFVNPLFSNYHNIKRGRGAQRGSGARMPPPHMPPGPPHMPQPVNMSTRSQCGGRGGRGGDNNHGDPYIEPPGEQLGDGIGVQEAIKHANMMPPQGRPGDWECGYCGNINFAREDEMFKTFTRSCPSYLENWGSVAINVGCSFAFESILPLATAHILLQQN